MSEVWRSLSLRLAIALVALGLIASSAAVFSPTTLFAEEEFGLELDAGGWEGEDEAWSCEGKEQHEYCHCMDLAQEKYGLTCNRCRQNTCLYQPGHHCYLSCTCYGCTGGN